MTDFPTDIFTEPDGDNDTLANLGPLRALAGIWEGTGEDTHPDVSGTETEPYVERYELQPIDRQTNGPQLYYGLRYHTHITRPGEIETFHDQVGYWLWEPATGSIVLTLSLPRGQAAMLMGKAAKDAKSFRVEAVRGEPTNGIISNPFLEYAFRTMRCTVDVTIHDDGSWSYAQDTELLLPKAGNVFHHIDKNRLKKIGEPTPNPLASEK
jgi:hypothetical protein